MIDFLFSLIYPNKCIVCFDIIKDGYECAKCTSKNYFACFSCEKKHEKTSERNSFVYEGVPKEVILKFKFSKKPFMAKGLAYYMHKYISPKIWEGIDFLTFVPIHKKKMRSRGFNQAELLANELGKLTNLPVKNCLIRAKHTEALKGISKDDRAEVIKDAIFHNEKIDVLNKKILIIDDIYTTGATIEKCSDVLLFAGAFYVDYASFCIVEKKNKEEIL